MTDLSSSVLILPDTSLLLAFEHRRRCKPFPHHVDGVVVANASNVASIPAREISLC